MAEIKRSESEIQEFANVEPTLWERMKEYVYTQSRKVYLAHIPMESVKELPDFYKFYLGTMAYAVMISIFVTFTWISYQQATTQPYMSLDSTSGVCSTVPSKLVSGVFQADAFGKWIGQKDFEYPFSIYSISIEFLSKGQPEYAAAMRQFQLRTEALSEVGKRSTLPINLLYWINYLNVYDDSSDASSLSFQFTGYANQVFNLNYVHGQAGSIDGICNVIPDASYDAANGLISLQYDQSNYFASSLCMQSVNPYAVGYYPTVSGEFFDMVLDVNSFSTAMAINLGINKLSILSQVPYKLYTVSLFGLINMTFGEYFDPRTPAMDTIICLSNVTTLKPLSSFPLSYRVFLRRFQEHAVCFLLYGGLPVLPVFNHYGATTSAPDYCSCETGVGQSGACQEFNLLASLLYYNVDTNTTAESLNVINENTRTEFTLLLSLLNSTGTYIEFNRLAYNASWMPASQAYHAASAVTNSKKWRRNAFDFCASSGVGVTQYCSVVTFNPFAQADRGVSQYNYQLDRGSCSDTFTVNASIWDSLIAGPPTSFVQDYFACTMDPTSALTSAAGIAQGNVATVLPFVVVFSLPLMYLVLMIIGQDPPKEEYNSDERKAALNAFSIQLLRLRDGKVRGMVSKGYLLGLGRELMMAAKLEGGYPDSDDEAEGSDSDDENDEEGENGDAGKSSPRPKVNRDSEAGNTSRISQTKISLKTGRRSSLNRNSVSRGSIGRNSLTAREKQKQRAHYHRTNFDVFVSPELRAKYEKPAPATLNESADDGDRFSMMVNPLSKAFGLGLARRPNTNQQSDIELGNVTVQSTGHQKVMILNDDTLNADIKAQFQAQNKVLAKLSLAEVAKRLLKRLSDAIAEGSTSVPANLTESYAEARLLAMSLAKVHYDEDDEDSEYSQVFMTLTSALVLHTSVALNCTAKEAGEQYHSKIAYNVGGQLYTVNQFKQMAETHG